MTIRIRTKRPPNGIAQPVTGNIQVTDEHGNEVRSITRLNIHTDIGDVVRANVEIFIDELDIHAEESMVYVDKDGNKYKMIEEAIKVTPLA